MIYPRLRAIKLDLLMHFLIALVISGVIYLKTRNAVLVAVFVVGGILIDLDHFYDYFLFAGWRFDPGEFFGSKPLRMGKVYLYLHSWELNFLVFAAGLALKSPALLILALGMAVHLAVDNLQRENPLFYFIVYRMRKKFDVEILLPEFVRKPQGRGK